MTHQECERYESLLSSLVDGETAPGDPVELMDHVVRCVACRRFYREARALDGLAVMLRPPGEAAPPQLWERIRVAAEDGQRRRKAIPGWALRLAAGVVLTAGLGFLLARGDDPVAVRGATATPPAEVEVVLAGEPDSMNEARFVELTTEVLRADRRYHQAMYQVMEQVLADTGAGESRVTEVERAREESGEGGEPRRRERDLV